MTTNTDTPETNSAVESPAGPRRSAGPGRPARRRPTPGKLAGAAAGAAGIGLLVLLPLLNLSLPGVLPGPTYTPGSLQLLAMCMLMAAAALTYHLLLGVAGLLSFGHALYFAPGSTAWRSSCRTWTSRCCRPWA